VLIQRYDVISSKKNLGRENLEGKFRKIYVAKKKLSKKGNLEAENFELVLPKISIYTNQETYL